VKNQKGFALIILISLLPLIMAGGLLVFCGFSFIKTDLGTLNLCRALQLEVQNKAAQKLESLLKLNPRALKLRLAQIRAEKTLALAVKSGNPAALAAAEAHLLTIRMQRQVLDLKQRSLITSANTSLKLGGLDLQRRLSQEWYTQSRGVTSWLQGKLQLGSGKIPALAVQPDFVEVAPLYEPAPQFEEAQAWHQEWQLEFRTISWADKFFNFHERFQRSCSTSLYSENSAWSARLKKAKSWWRGSS
jgi:hypothetical protein